MTLPQGCVNPLVNQNRDGVCSWWAEKWKKCIPTLTPRPYLQRVAPLLHTAADSECMCWRAQHSPRYKKSEQETSCAVIVLSTVISLVISPFLKYPCKIFCESFFAFPQRSNTIPALWCLKEAACPFSEAEGLEWQANHFPCWSNFAFPMSLRDAAKSEWWFFCFRKTLICVHVVKQK